MNLPGREEFQKIYSALQDDVSREIYKHRLLYALFNEREEILKIIKHWSDLKVDLDIPKLCFYGAGEGCRTLLQYSGIRVPFVIDSHRTGSLEGCPILSLEDFLELPDCREYLVIIAVGKEDAKREIAASLNSRELRYVEAYPDGQYFDLPELRLQDEYFVDAGAFDGGTASYFLSRFPGGHAYVLEPGPEQFKIAKERLRDYSQAELLPYGAFDQNATLFFDTTDASAGSARISESGNTKIEVRKLDDLLEGRKVTFIKMDIEGSELAALRGAAQIIRAQRPKLAICVYHKPEDMWEIPSQILQYHPDYKLYLRHYSIYDTETVLYAV